MRLRYILTVAAAVLLITSCKTATQMIEVERPVYIHDTLQNVQVLRDSVVIDHFREVTKMGDTVFVRDSIVRLHTVTQRDTVREYIEKPIKVSEKQTVTKIEKKPIIRNWVFWCVLSAFFIGGVYLSGKFLKK